MAEKKGAETVITTLIGAGAKMGGDFSAPGSVRIDGAIEGNVTVEGTLILGAGGSVSGSVMACSAVIGGEILGDVTVQQKVELTNTAKVLGDITTSVIVIDENAVFQGRCNMNQPVSDIRARARAAKAFKASKKSAKLALAEALKEVKEAESREQETENGTQEAAGNTSDTAYENKAE